MTQLAHLHVRDTSFACTSRAPQADVRAYRQQMGWTTPWYAIGDESFYNACGITAGFGLGTFLRDGEQVYRPYFVTDRGAETVGPGWSLLDLTALGRQAEWEDSPAGYPQTPTFQWWRRHDEYDQ